MQPCLFLVDRKAKSNYVYPRHNRSPLVGHDVRENHTARLFFVFIFSYIYEKSNIIKYFSKRITNNTTHFIFYPWLCLVFSRLFALR